MGYYTSYSIEFGCDDASKIEAVEKELLEISKYPDGQLDPEMKELVEYGGVYAKLRNINDYLDKVAADNPDVLIILSGCGEEQEDIWERRWKGNDYEEQISKIPPFSKLSLLTPYELEKRTITL